MVHLNQIRKVNKANLTSRPFVAVFVGATTGIGEYTLRALAYTHGKDGRGLRVYLVGRNAKAANTILRSCRTTCPQGEFMFIKVDDLALLRNVDKGCHEILQQEHELAKRTPAAEPARIDLLVMTQALFGIKGRQETTEGLDHQLSLLYYSRARFVQQLLSLLLAAPQPAHVVSVFAAGAEAKIIEDDLDLRKPENYGFYSSRSHAMTFQTLFYESIVKASPGRISISNVFPGLVITPAFSSSSMPTWLSTLFTIFMPVMRWIALSPEECGQRILYAGSPTFPALNETLDGQKPKGTDGQAGSGVYSVGEKGETTSASHLAKHYEPLRKRGVDKKIVEHTLQVFAEIESSGKFTG